MSEDHASLQSTLCGEVERLHQFIAFWFQGAQPAQELDFQGEFADQLAHDFINIQPSGQILTRSDLLDGIQQDYGANPDFGIQISDCELQWQNAEQTFALVTYLEHQTGAKNTTPADNTRRSSVLFEVRSGLRPLWLHIHETAV